MEEMKDNCQKMTNMGTIDRGFTVLILTIMVVSLLLPCILEFVGLIPGLEVTYPG
jgi:hypothetical protein